MIYCFYYYKECTNNSFIYRTYKSLNKKSINPVPSVLDLRGLMRSVSSSEHVGIQSGIDLHEKKVADCKYRGPQRNGDITNNNNNSSNIDNTNSNSNGMTPSTPPTSSSNDPTSMLVVEDAPLRYDVDIVTKLIVYSGKEKELIAYHDTDFLNLILLLFNRYWTSGSISSTCRL